MSKSIKRDKIWVTTTERFVVFLDIMGFKDFVSRNSHTDVYEMMTKISKSKEIIDGIVDENAENDKYSDKGLYTTSFSDSIILFSKDDTSESLELISSCAAFIVADAMENSIPMKGAISYGTVSVNKAQQIYFGQPIIDAYLLQEEVQYYGIIAHNTIDAFIAKKQLRESLKELYTEVKTPLKTGVISHLNIKWFEFLNLDEKDKEIRKNSFYDYINKIKFNTSGHPRKYIDNTIALFETITK